MSPGGAFAAAGTHLDPHGEAGNSGATRKEFSLAASLPAFDWNAAAGRAEEEPVAVGDAVADPEHPGLPADVWTAEDEAAALQPPPPNHATTTTATIGSGVSEEEEARLAALLKRERMERRRRLTLRDGVSTPAAGAAGDSDDEDGMPLGLSEELLAQVATSEPLKPPSQQRYDPVTGRSQRLEAALNGDQNALFNDAAEAFGKEVAAAEEFYQETEEQVAARELREVAARGFLLDREDAVVGVFAYVDSDNEQETTELLDEHASKLRELAALPPDEATEDALDKLHRQGEHSWLTNRIQTGMRVTWLPFTPLAFLTRILCFAFQGWWPRSSNLGMI